MQKRARDIYHAIERPLISFTAVLLSCVVFLIVLWSITIGVRFIVGLS